MVGLIERDWRAAQRGLKAVPKVQFEHRISSFEIAIVATVGRNERERSIFRGGLPESRSRHVGIERKFLTVAWCCGNVRPNGGLFSHPWNPICRDTRVQQDVKPDSEMKVGTFQTSKR
jgi:hypothetical protein